MKIDKEEKNRRTVIRLAEATRKKLQRMINTVASMDMDLAQTEVMKAVIRMPTLLDVLGANDEFGDA